MRLFKQHNWVFVLIQNTYCYFWHFVDCIIHVTLYTSAGISKKRSPYICNNCSRFLPIDILDVNNEDFIFLNIFITEHNIKVPALCTSSLYKLSLYQPIHEQGENDILCICFVSANLYMRCIGRPISSKKARSDVFLTRWHIIKHKK